MTARPSATGTTRADDVLDRASIGAGQRSLLEPEPEREAVGSLEPAVLRIAIPTGPTPVPTEIPVDITRHHTRQRCLDPPCALHAPSLHLLARQPMRLRFEFTDRGTATLPVVVERACPRVAGRWHPDVDSLRWLAGRLDPVRYALIRAHVCDCGCCPSVELDLVLQGQPPPPVAAQILTVTTLNSVYELDLRGRARRVTGLNPPTLCFTPDGHWQPVTLIAQPRLAESWVVHHASGRSCVSSIVTRIEASG
jgi:hypothetical protein